MKNNFWQVITRSLCGRCPKCGNGKLFSRYLKQVDHCAACNEEWGAIRADDGPAWLTILIVGHIMAPLMLAFIPDNHWPDAVSMTFWPVLALLLIFLVLPRAKGLFIAMVWRTQKV